MIKTKIDIESVVRISYTIAQQNILSIITIAFLAYLIPLILQGILLLDAEQFGHVIVLPKIVHSMLSAANTLITTSFPYICAAWFSALCLDYFSGKKPDHMRALRSIALFGSRIPCILGIVIIASLPLFLQKTFMGRPSLSMDLLVVTVGFVASVASFYLTVRCFWAVQILQYENLNMFAAIKRSFQLTHGNGFPLFGLCFIVTMVHGIIITIFSNMLIELSVSNILSIKVASWLSTLIIMPFFGLLMNVSYLSNDKRYKTLINNELVEVFE